MLYVLGLSYGGVADALAAFGWAGSKSSVYRDVQAAGEAVTRVRQRQPRREVKVVSADATYVVCHGQQVTVAVALDALAGDVLDIELVDSESADALRTFLTQLQEEYGMEVLVSDDQDSYKTLADELGVDAQHLPGACQPQCGQDRGRVSRGGTAWPDRATARRAE